LIHNGQRVTVAGIVELLVGSADGHFELQGVYADAVNRLRRDPVFALGEGLERVRHEPRTCSRRIERPPSDGTAKD
jgi:hypothetical protein